jgi:hypothetical protein
MQNNYRGQVPVRIGDADLTLQFDYDALALIRSNMGEDNAHAILSLTRGLDPKLFSQLVAIALHRNHPDWTAELVYAEFPPPHPTMQALIRAYNLFYFGPDGRPKETGENPLMRIVRMMLRAIRLAPRSA